LTALRVIEVTERKREKMDESQTRILLATDSSKASCHAAERAVHLAGHLRAKLYVLYAVDKDRAFHAGIHYGEDLRELEKAGKEATEKVAALAEKHRLECEKLVVEGGRAARTIVWEAQEVGADYIVMGAAGMSRLESIIVGNVAQEVLRRADRTVLLVGGHRSPDDPMLSRRSERTDLEVALAEHETSSETPEKKVVE
jgi:nucleotide-binding universal stress UspA family protein